MNKCVKCGEFKPPMTFIAGCTYCPKCYAELTDEEAFFKEAREMAEGLTREQLIEYYMGELETCCKVEEELKVYKIALKLACDAAQFENTCDFCKYNKEVGCPCYCETDQNFNRDMAAMYFEEKAREELKSEITK